jgi:FAD/FMN-containing dehydrogenase
MVKITTLDGGNVSLDDATLRDFGGAVRGEVLTMNDDGYDGARSIFNGMIDRRPALIVRCTGVADVIHGVNFAREHRLLTAVRGGGHGVAGNAVCDGGLMIDLSLMKSVRVDPQARLAWVQGGAALGDVDHETHVFGLVAPGGVVSTTGVAGLTTGGGYGWLRGKLGMSIDNLRAVEIVTADGELRRASDTDNTDLFWAVRGGGGNFGVVTRFEFRLHPMPPQLMVCNPIYTAERARDVLHGWRAFMAKAPEEFTTEFFFWTIPDHPNFPEETHGQHVVIPCGVYFGPVEEGEKFVQPLRELAPVLLDFSGPQRFIDIQRMFDPYLPYGKLRSYWKALYMDRLSDDMIDTLVEVFLDRPAVACPFVLHDLRGASRRVADDATAFPARQWAYLMEYNSSWPDPAQTEAVVAWTRRIWNEMRETYSQEGGGYLNMTNYNEDGELLVEKTYRENYRRLQEIKKKYDPANLFRMNPNILPRRR